MGQTVEKILTIKMKGLIDDINNYCEQIGELSNDFPDLEVDFS